MLRPNREELMRRLPLLTLLLTLVVCLHAPNAAVSQTQSQLGPIKDGIGVGEILIGVSSAADVEARYGMKYKLINKNDYSYRMEYADQGPAFYYCYKDEKKRVFLVEMHQGVTSKGIIVGESTLKDVFRLYGEQSGVSQSDIYEYKGIQFYLEHDPTPEREDKAPKLDKKVVEVDIVPPDKSSNFCD
jgi:hypothetical protein